ncbi:MAG TPA: hypothetical protein VIS76_05600 [Pseudomonadales bacterium]
MSSRHDDQCGRASVLLERLPAILLATVLLSGCVTATVQQVREASTGLHDSEAVVVLGRKDRPSADETESNFVRCVGERMGRGGSPMKVISESDFRDALFPWFEPRTAPANTSDLPEIMSTPVVAGRLSELGLRYLVWIDGSTVRTDSSGSMTCSVTGAGGGCFGFLTWENDSSYEATVWDVRSGQTVGRVSSDAIGTSYIPAVVVPVPLIARVQNSACNSLSNQLKSFILEG